MFGMCELPVGFVKFSMTNYCIGITDFTALIARMKHYRVIKKTRHR